MMKCVSTALAITFVIVPFTIGLSDEPQVIAKRGTAAVEVEASSPCTSPSPEEARRQAEILHEAMHATLQVVHHRYYREDEGLPLPAAMLTDVFAELEKEQHVKLRWLAVEGQVMNSDHKPRDQFENEAVKALKLGKQEYERVENGVYRRVGPITLTNHCLKCHVPDRKTTLNRTAGLIVAIPIKEK